MHLYAHLLTLPFRTAPQTLKAQARKEGGTARSGAKGVGSCLAQVRRQVALLAASARALLAALQAWGAPSRNAVVAERCAAELARLYEAIAERQVRLTGLVVIRWRERCRVHAKPSAAATGAKGQVALPHDVVVNFSQPQQYWKWQWLPTAISCLSMWLAFAQDVLGMYCHFLLADYITLAAAPANPIAAVSEEPQAGEEDAHAGPGLGLLPAAALRPGACALYGACSPAQVPTPPCADCA